MKFVFSSKSAFLVLFLFFQSVFVYAECRIDILQLNSKNGSTGFFRVNKTITLECERFLEKNPARMNVELDSNGFFRYQGADGWLLFTITDSSGLNQQVKRYIVSHSSVETILIGREDTPYYSFRGSPYPVLSVPKLLFLQLKTDISEKELKLQQTKLQKMGLVQVNGFSLYSIDKTKTTVSELALKLKEMENIVHLGITEDAAQGANYISHCGSNHSGCSSSRHN